MGFSAQKSQLKIANRWRCSIAPLDRNATLLCIVFEIASGFWGLLWASPSASPKPHPSKPHPCNMPQAKTEVALQFSECCAAETALQHWLCCSAEVIWTRSCAAANEKLHCNIEKAALQESGTFLPLSCGFQAPTFRHPRLVPVDAIADRENRCDFGAL